MYSRPCVLCVRARFTLTELLVVVGVIAVLIALLMPALARARFMAERAACLSQVRQWGASAAVFGSDHDGRVPRGMNMWNAGSREVGRWAFVNGGGGAQFLDKNFNNLTQPAQGYFGGTSTAYGVMNQGQRVTPLGAMVCMGYMSDDPSLWYCTDQPDTDTDDRGESLYRLDTVIYRNGNDTTTPRVNDLLDGDDTFTTHRPFNKLYHAIGYSHYLWVAPQINARHWSSGLGEFNEEHPYLHDAVPDLKFQRLAKFANRECVNWDASTTNLNPSEDDINYSPMMFSCANGYFVGGERSHDYAGTGQGVNGSFYDGSARWIGIAEVRRLAIDGTAVSDPGHYASSWRLLGNTLSENYYGYGALQYIAHENLTVTQ